MEPAIPAYRYLPFRFKRIGGKRLLINDVGEFIYLNESDFGRLVRGELQKTEDLYLDLLSSNIISNNYQEEQIELIATQLRTQKTHLSEFTSLHIIVVTLRCNHQCIYCHANSCDIYGKETDMDIQTIKRCIETIFLSPSLTIKIEFQGGEPLLNYRVVKEGIEYAYLLNKEHKKDVEIVICTNMTLMTDEIIKFIKDNNIMISTSLDGPEKYHDANRKMRDGGSSYNKAIKNIEWVMGEIGRDKVSALMTTTKYNLHHLEDVIDEYIELGMTSIFIRNLNLFGRASENNNEIGYSTEDYLNYYKSAIKYIFELNRKGHNFTESYVALLITKILTPFSVHFVDLQSPAGVGISGVVYYYNGDIYISDEARMYAREGNEHFKLGNILDNSYNEIFLSRKIKNIIKNTIIESLPACAECVYQPYCGINPVYNYKHHGTYIGNRVNDHNCRKNKYLFDMLFTLINTDDIEDILWAWVNNKPVSEIKI